MNVTTLQAKVAWIATKSRGYHDGYDLKFPLCDATDFLCYAHYMRGYEAGQADRYWEAVLSHRTCGHDAAYGDPCQSCDIDDEADMHDLQRHTDDPLDMRDQQRDINNDGHVPEWGF